jgi:hypothetical protein
MGGFKLAPSSLLEYILHSEHVRGLLEFGRVPFVCVQLKQN